MCIVKRGGGGLRIRRPTGTFAGMRRISLALLLVAACSTNEKKETNTPANAGKEGGLPAPAQIDRSRCDPSGKKVVDIDVNGDNKPDVRKFYVAQMENGARVDVLTCKESDLNFDGKRDYWVYYDNAGNITLEEFDFDLDGKVESWAYRQNNKIVREEQDFNFDGKPDLWKFYDNYPKLTRIEISSKRNGKVDVWEYYEGGKLDRIGYDTTGSGQVDRWDRAPEEAPAAGEPGNPAGGATPTAAAPPPSSTAKPTVTPDPSGAKK
jgi:hypothetical protein